MRTLLLSMAVVVPMLTNTAVAAPTPAELEQNLQALQQQLDAVQQQLAKLDPTQPVADTGIKLGGAVRFNYRYEDGNSQRGGDMKFDTFRLDLRGQVDGILLGSKWRWFEDKALIQTAWMGYNVSQHAQVRVGLDLIPFGNQEYNSHNFDLSPNFYLGLEDTYAFGGTYHYRDADWDVQTGLFKNSSSRINGTNTNYSPNLIGLGNALDVDGKPTNKVGEVNAGALRVVRIFQPSNTLNIQLGGSGLYGGVENTTSNVGEYQAYALHSEISFKQWHVQLQATHYEYDLRGGVTQLIRGFYGTEVIVANRASTYTANVAYRIPVQWGPISQLDFYNDHTQMTQKSANADSSYDNVLGVGIAAGPVYVFLDWTTETNGGDMTVKNPSTNHKFNANVGYYF